MDDNIIPVECKEVKDKEMDWMSKTYSEAYVKLSETLEVFGRFMQVWVEDVWTPVLQAASESFSDIAKAWSDWCKKGREKMELIRKAKVYGLSGRVIQLTSHRKKRIGKKNLSRLRKMVTEYERYHTPCGSDPGSGL